MIELSPYLADSGKHKGNEAAVYKTAAGYLVEFFEHSTCTNSFTFANHALTTLQRAQDLAENYVLGTEEYIF